MKGISITILALAYTILLILTFSISKQAFAITTIDSCGVLNVQGETYFLTKNIVPTSPVSYCLTITADNITVDCKDFSVTGNGEITGIRLRDVSGVTVKNCVVENFRTGIHDAGGTMNTVQSNTVKNNEENGIVINAIGDTIIWNTAKDNGTGIGVSGSNNDLIYNKSNSNKRYGIIFHSGFVFETGKGDNVAIKNQAQKNQRSGILVNKSDFNHLVKNRVNSNVENGVEVLANSDNNKIAGNNAENNGIYGFKDHTLLKNKVNNHYLKNTCKNNVKGGSNSGNLCEPQI